MIESQQQLNESRFVRCRQVALMAHEIYSTISVACSTTRVEYKLYVINPGATAARSALKQL
jgi:hypothetical protein